MFAATADSYNIDYSLVAVDIGCQDTLDCYHNYSVPQVAVEFVVAAAAAAVVVVVGNQLDTAATVSVLYLNMVSHQQQSSSGFVEHNLIDQSGYRFAEVGWWDTQVQCCYLDSQTVSEQKWEHKIERVLGQVGLPVADIVAAVHMMSQVAHCLMERMVQCLVDLGAALAVMVGSTVEGTLGH